MNDEDRKLLKQVLEELQKQNSANKGFIESAEPMTATCEVERSDE